MNRRLWRVRLAGFAIDVNRMWRRTPDRIPALPLWALADYAADSAARKRLR